MRKKLDKSLILNYLKEHSPEFQEKYSVERIGLFGSYAKDTASDSSDIDLFVTMKPSLFAMAAIKEQIEYDLQRKVDIVRDHKNIKPLFLETIRKDLIYV
ncbi:nucleotidyltransferase family protein [Chrysiogenes arsenatis]|uniref:nucleotidyltransferase family protein n=1 Tax=Chrysiogenes arsenatis TaxID=309797 RepID=UPI0003FAC8C1|nr:nucleotidyltransferase domain-containing protein [Chrysiogenes arsenatis]